MHVIISQPPKEKKEEGKKTQVRSRKPKPKYSLKKKFQKATSQKHTSTKGMYVQRNITPKP
jgi:hypothetical protein